jgi:hypothetical protein
MPLKVNTVSFFVQILCLTRWPHVWYIEVHWQLYGANHRQVTSLVLAASMPHVLLLCVREHALELINDAVPQPQECANLLLWRSDQKIDECKPTQVRAEGT